MSRLTRDGTATRFRETKFSGTNADREILIFLVELTTCRLGNLTRLIDTLAKCETIHTYMIDCLLLLFKEKSETHLNLLSIPQSGEKNVKTFRWDHRLQIRNLFMAVKRLLLFISH